MTDDTTPATKADIERLIELMDRRFESVNDGLDRRFGYVNDGIDRVLAVLVNVDKRLTEDVKDHEQRITRLERRIGIVV